MKTSPTSDELKEWFRLAKKIGLIINWRQQQNGTVEVEWITQKWDCITYAIEVHPLEELREICRFFN